MSVPLKTIAWKTKAEWGSTGENKYIDVGNSFILMKVANEIDCNNVFFDRPRLSRVKSLYFKDGEGILIPSKRL